MAATKDEAGFIGLLVDACGVQDRVGFVGLLVDACGTQSRAGGIYLLVDAMNVPEPGLDALGPLLQVTGG